MFYKDYYILLYVIILLVFNDEKLSLTLKDSIIDDILNKRNEIDPYGEEIWDE